MALSVSEMFYSIQGEGRWAGTPAVFLRLSGCNLRCPGFSYDFPLGDGTFEHHGCDTYAVWRKGSKMENEEIVLNWERRGWIDKLRLGINRCHLVITGGEPLLHQAALVEFLDELMENEDIGLRDNVYIEVETNGTQIPCGPLEFWIDQFNVSPKLMNSGELMNKRLVPEAIVSLRDSNADTCWKFVVDDMLDAKELLEHYVRPFHLPPGDVYIMPEGGTRKAMAKNTKAAANICKNFCFNFSPRLHIDIWDEATGV